jgi:hypothetical protein
VRATGFLDHGKIGGQNRPGFLTLVSERIPSSSRTQTIRRFLKKNPWVNLRIFYFHNTEDRGAPDFVNECGDAKIVK